MSRLNAPLLAEGGPQPQGMERRYEAVPMGVPVAEGAALDPWQVGPQNVYAPTTCNPITFARPEDLVAQPNADEPIPGRRQTLLEWGRRRERKMQRAPR